MKAVLDHVGIAVQDLEAALAFFRDGLGLDVQVSEDVRAQRVRAHFMPAGESSLELLEATAADSAIARYLERRGPGLHHITLRVADIGAALDRLRSRGVRLVDDRPRLGAEGAMVAFVHPSSAHGVLVELKQPPGAAATHARDTEASSAAGSLVKRVTLGELELISLSDGFFHLDGGAMFGVVPKALWESKAPADGRNRIRLGLRPLVVRGAQTLLIDAGIGDKRSRRFVEIYGVERERHLVDSLAEAGVSVGDIDIVVASHLHFDHAGGFTALDERGVVRPRFPRARYLVRRGEWGDASAPSERSRASYLAQDFAPLAEAGVVRFMDDDGAVMPGVRVRHTGGHTMHHQLIEIESGGRKAVFVADLIPTTAHLQDSWIMGYDLYPMDTLAYKQVFIPEAIAQEHLIFFEHDPTVVAGYIREKDGKRIVEQVL